MIEDEPGVAEMLRDAFEANAFPVAVLDHLQGTEDLPPDLHPDVFVIDLMLPDLDGVEVAQLLREQGFRSTPMIGMSASRVLTEQAARSGVFDEVFRKPFDLHMLLDRVRRHRPRVA
ncbi:MAG: response regulator transcription factor [Chloroflexi bacterium]|nr:response regulator transcription factor [Chloroflexota bacterium]